MRNKIFNNAFLILATLLYCAVSKVTASTPVLSDIKVIGNNKGLGILITADSPFDAHFDKIGSNKVRVIIDNCIYGLSTFDFTNKTSDRTLSRLSVKEIKESSTIQLEFLLSNKINIQIETRKKNAQWIALLTRTSCPDYSWSALESEKNSFGKNETTVKEPVDNENDNIETLSNTALVGSQDSTDGIVKLLNVRFMQRKELCALTFDMSGVVQSEVKRAEDTVYIQLTSASIGLKNDKINIPKGSPFRSIRMQEKADSKKQRSILIAVVLDKRATNIQKGIVYSKDNSVTLYSNAVNNDKLSQWNSDNDMKWEQEFYDLPTYKVDMNYLEKRATTEAGNQLKDETSFSMGENIENNNELKKADYDSNEKKDDKEEIEKSKSYSEALVTEKKTETMIVTSKNVNLRVKPTVVADVISKLIFGDKLTPLDVKGQWYRVEINSLEGWVHEKCVSDSSKVPPTVWKEIYESRPKIVQKTEKPMINQYVEFKENIKNQDINDNKIESDKVKKSEKQTVKYNRKGRDPFLPLEGDSLGDANEIVVEHLKLVGILLDNSEQLALCEDTKANNKPIPLRENDPVSNGKVLKIYKDKVVFLITEYGISRSYTIRLATKQDREAGK